MVEMLDQGLVAQFLGQGSIRDSATESPCARYLIAPCLSLPPEIVEGASRRVLLFWLSQFTLGWCGDGSPVPERGDKKSIVFKD